ncbi:MAG: deoxyguanosinetriphosphate triphosphohydrolase [Candidatus Omnitrophica bacterium]|nr:deoxyguanosinetriphosphate triphosphohydrolase [Candidatus Omnitrophota bacterium]
MNTRKDIEDLEEKILAPYAMKSRDSRGREHDNSQHPVRTAYQRDRDRIVHSEAFRKLEYKTQVFVILEGDYYRTRLTHTIEVAQIARTIGRCLRLNEDLIEAIALAHDLGHPPFGHAGEHALNLIMAGKGGFDHNFRSYKIVTDFEKRYPKFNGLDLTEEVRVGILKHETSYDIKGELEKYQNIGPTLEAKVVDVADALAYLSHDIDDGLTSGCISKDDLMESQLWRESYQNIDDQLDPENKEMLKYQVVKFLIDIQTQDLLQHSTEMLKKKNFKNSQEVKDYHLGNPVESVIGFSSEMKRQRDSLQQLLYDKLYSHYRVIRMTEKAKRIIEDIFNVYKRNPDQLPYKIWPRVSKTFNLPYDTYDKLPEPLKNELDLKTFPAICNYIAGMTDRSAFDEHKKLFDPFKKV